MVLFSFKYAYLGQMVNVYIVLSSKSKDKIRSLTQRGKSLVKVWCILP